MYHRKRCKQTVELWQRELLRVPPSRQLLFLYVANDVMQSSRKRGPEFIKEFGRVIPDAVRLVYSAATSPNDELAKKILRLLSIWEERKVFPSAFIRQIQATLKTASESANEKASTKPLPQTQTQTQTQTENNNNNTNNNSNNKRKNDNNNNDDNDEDAELSHIDRTLERNLQTEKNIRRHSTTSGKTPVSTISFSHLL
jgi:hypothetical protein